MQVKIKHTDSKYTYLFSGHKCIEGQTLRPFSCQDFVCSEATPCFRLQLVNHSSAFMG